VARGIVFAVEVQLGLRLKDEALREQEFIGGVDTPGKVAAVAPVEGGLKIEAVRGEALDAERGPGAGGSGVEIGAEAGLRVEVTQARDGAVVEELIVTVADEAVLGGAFGLDPELVEVSAAPDLAVPAEGIVRAIGAALELVKEHMREDVVAAHGVFGARNHRGDLAGGVAVGIMTLLRKGLRTGEGKKQHYHGYRCATGRAERGSVHRKTLSQTLSHGSTTTVRNMPASMW